MQPEAHDMIWRQHFTSEWLRGENAELPAAVRARSLQELPLPGIVSLPLAFLL